MSVVTVYLGSDKRTFHLDYGEPINLDGAESQIHQLLVNEYNLRYLTLMYIGRWEWTIHIDGRRLGKVYWR